MEVAPGGGSDRPEPDPEAEGVLFVVDGDLRLVRSTASARPGAGGYAYLPPGAPGACGPSATRRRASTGSARPTSASPGIDAPDAFLTSESEITPAPMPGTDGAWATTRFVGPTTCATTCTSNIVTLRPGASIPFEETHVMEHGLFVLEGKAVYRLNRDWVEVEAGDFMWLRAFCPQACYAGGPGRFRYLLYKDVNRHAGLRLRSGSR